MPCVAKKTSEWLSNRVAARSAVVDYALKDFQVLRNNHKDLRKIFVVVTRLSTVAGELDAKWCPPRDFGHDLRLIIYWLKTYARNVKVNFYSSYSFIRRINEGLPVPVAARSKAARLLRSWVRIPPGAWMFVVSVVCCQVEVSATSWSLSRGILLTVVCRVWYK